MIGTEVRIRTNKDAAGAVRRGGREAMMDAATEGFRISQERVASQSTDTGQLLRSGFPPEWIDGSVVWGYAADYAQYVERGTRPHWPPVDALRGWARRVLGDESAAYAVAAKIAQEGTDPAPFVKPGIDAMRARLAARGLKAAVSDNL